MDIKKQLQNDDRTMERNENYFQKFNRRNTKSKKNLMNEIIAQDKEEINRYKGILNEITRANIC